MPLVCSHLTLHQPSYSVTRLLQCSSHQCSNHGPRCHTARGILLLKWSGLVQNFSVPTIPTTLKEIDLNSSLNAAGDAIPNSHSIVNQTLTYIWKEKFSSRLQCPCSARKHRAPQSYIKPHPGASHVSGACKPKIE